MFVFFFRLALQLKNALYSKEATLKQVYHERWLSLPENIRAHIKNNVCILSLSFSINISYLFYIVF